MYGAAEELSDLPTLMNNLLSSAATFWGHPDGAGTARLLEAAAQALQQQVAETKVRRRRRRRRHTRSRGPRGPRRPPCASRAACAPSPLPSPCACRHVAATARVLAGAARAGDRVADAGLRAEHQVREPTDAPRAARARRRQRRRPPLPADADGDALRRTARRRRRLDRAHISPISRLYLAYISLISPPLGGGAASAEPNLNPNPNPNPSPSPTLTRTVVLTLTLTRTVVLTLTLTRRRRLGAVQLPEGRVRWLPPGRRVRCGRGLARVPPPAPAAADAAADPGRAADPAAAAAAGAADL